MDDWLPGYEQVPILGCTGPNSYRTGTAWKLILHTTESGAGSTPGIVRFFRSNPCSTPHFCIDPSDGRKVQFIPLSMSSAALRGGRNGFDTNRAHAVQVEIIGRANETEGWPDEWLAFLGSFVADLVRAGVPLNLDNVADFDVHGTVAIEGSPYRMTGQEFHDFDGTGGHIHAPFNDHYDPHRMNVLRVIEHAKADLAGEGLPLPPAPPPVVVPPSPSFGPGVIGPGMEGGVVKFAQELLIGLGYDCGAAGADGVFGDGTLEGVKAFQRDAELVADGLIGPLTMKAIGDRYATIFNPGVMPEPVAPSSPVWPGRYLVLQSPFVEGADVRQWQSRMAERGWPLGVDGVYGPQSAAVCEDFQDEKGLKLDGVVGPLTWQAAWTSPVT